MTEKRSSSEHFVLRLFSNVMFQFHLAKQVTKQVGGYQQTSFIDNAFNADVVCCSPDDINSPSDEEDKENTGSVFE